MKRSAILSLLILGMAALLCISPAVAKPKPAALVYVKAVQGRGVGFTITSDSRSSGISNDSGEKVYVNVVVSARTPDYAQAVAKNDGKWCLQGTFEMQPNSSYDGLLQGDGIDVVILQQNGKTRKMHFSIVARQWRNLDFLLDTRR